MSETVSSSSSGIGVFGLLGCVFVTLKLCGVINWSWWYVTMPFWGGLALVLTVVIMSLGFAAMCVAVLAACTAAAKRKKKKK